MNASSNDQENRVALDEQGIKEAIRDKGLVHKDYEALFQLIPDPHAYINDLKRAIQGKLGAALIDQNQSKDISLGDLNDSKRFLIPPFQPKNLIINAVFNGSGIRSSHVEDVIESIPMQNLVRGVADAMRWRLLCMEPGNTESPNDFIRRIRRAYARAKKNEKEPLVKQAKDYLSKARFCDPSAVFDRRFTFMKSS